MDIWRIGLRTQQLYTSDIPRKNINECCLTINADEYINLPPSDTRTPEEWLSDYRAKAKEESKRCEGCLRCLVSKGLNNGTHAHWKWSFADNGWADWTCSNCGTKVNTDVHVEFDQKICHHCGATMDEKRSKSEIETDLMNFLKKVHSGV